MKKILFFLSLTAALGSCSFVKDVQSHCKVTETAVDAPIGSFKACLECDSLASVVKRQIAKAQSK